MTPDYTKLCAALTNYRSNSFRRTTSDFDQTEARTTNASIIGRLMNNVRLGYYPTYI